MTVAIVPNTRTNWYDPQIAAGAPVVIQNINYLTGDPNSVINSTIRFIQDSFKRWTASAVLEGYALGGQGTPNVTVSAGYATIHGRHLYNDAVVNVSAVITADDYYIVVTLTEDAEAQTRDPTNDAVTTTAVLVSGYTPLSNKLVLGKFTTDGANATVVTSYSQAGETRTGHIMPAQLVDGSSFATISMWTGATEKRQMAQFSGDNFNIINDNGKVQLGASQDLSFYHDGTHSYILNTTGTLVIDQDTAAGAIQLDLGGQLIVRDTDAANVVLFLLDTSARTFAIGGAADLIATSFYGDTSVFDADLIVNRESDAANAVLQLRADAATAGDVSYYEATVLEKIFRMSDTGFEWQDRNPSNVTLMTLVNDGTLTVGDIVAGTNSPNLFRLQTNQYDDLTVDRNLYTEFATVTSTTDAYFSLKVPQDAVAGTVEIVRYRGAGSVMGAEYLSGAGVTLHADNALLQLGASLDMVLYHNGSASVVESINDFDLLLWTKGVNQDIVLRSDRKILFLDDGDTGATVFDFNLDARTMSVGSETDPMNSLFYNTVTVNNSLAGGSPTLTSAHATDTLLTVTGNLGMSVLSAGVSDYDKFVVYDTDRLKFRTGAEVASDILTDNIITGAMIEADDQLHEIDFQTTKEIGVSMIPFDNTDGNHTVDLTNDRVRLVETSTTTGAKQLYFDASATIMLLQALHPTKTVTITTIITDMQLSSNNSPYADATVGFVRRGLNGSDLVYAPVTQGSPNTSRTKLTTNITDCTVIDGASYMVSIGMVNNGGAANTLNIFNIVLTYTLT